MDMSTEPRLDPRLKVPHGLTLPLRTRAAANRLYQKIGFTLRETNAYRYAL